MHPSSILTLIGIALFAMAANKWQRIEAEDEETGTYTHPVPLPLFQAFLSILEQVDKARTIEDLNNAYYNICSFQGSHPKSDLTDHLFATLKVREEQIKNEL